MIVIKPTYNNIAPCIKATFGTTSVYIKNVDNVSPIYLRVDNSSITQEDLNTRVPYTGAIANVDLGNYGLGSGYIDFDQTPTSSIQRARMIWDDDTRTVVLGIDGSLGGHLLRDQYWYVKNQSGATIPKGQVVYASGTLGASGRILIEKYLANGTIPSRFVIGVTAEDIANGADGNVMSFGKLRNINTSSYNDGDVLYASPTIAGGFTNVMPESPNNIVILAFVVHSANNGVLAIRPTFAGQIRENQDVSATSPSDGDVLQYVASTGLWTKTSSINFGTW